MSDLIEDYFARLQPSYRLPTVDTGGQRFPALEPTEEESVLGTLGRRVLGGVGYVGSLLDKTFGGRAIRGVLGGKPREALSIIPFSDTLGITDEADTVRGRDLLQKAGIVGPDSPGLNAGDVGGFLVDLLLDPSTYFSFGASALGRGGKLAKAAGVLPTTLRGRLGTTLGDLTTATNFADLGRVSKLNEMIGNAARVSGTALTPDVLQESLGGLARAHLPFSSGGALVGTGDSGLAMLDTLQKAKDLPGIRHVGQALAPVGSALAPVGRGLRALFDKDVGNAVTEPLQEANAVLAQRLPRAEATAKLNLLKEIAPLGEAGLLGEGVFPRTSAHLLDVLENAPPPPNFVGPPRPPLVPGSAEDIASSGLRRLLDEAQKREAKLGAGSQRLENYAPRSLAPDLKDPLASSGRPMRSLDPMDAHAVARQELFGDLPTNWINAMGERQFVTPNFDALTPLERSYAIRKEYLHPWEEMRQQLGRGEAVVGPATAMEQRWLDLKEYAPGARLRIDEEGLKRIRELSALSRERPLQAAEQAILNTLTEQAKNTRDFDRLVSIKNQADQLADYIGGLRPGPVFGDNLLADVQNRLVRGARREAKVDTLYDVLKGATRTPGTESVPLADVMNQLRHTANLTDEARPVLMRRMGLDPTQMAHHQQFDTLQIPRALAEDVQRTIRGFTQPESLQPLLGAFDSVTNLTKAAQVGPWPARYVRDFVQNLWSQFVGGHHDPRFESIDPRRYSQPLMDAYQVFRKGDVLEGAKDFPLFAGRSLTDEAATKELQQLAHAWGMAGQASRLTRDTDLVGPGARAASEAGVRLPGEVRPSLGKILGDMYNPVRWEDRNPLNIAGVGGRTVTTFTPMKSAHELSGFIDDITRGGSFLAMLRQGYTPEAAAQAVKKSLYDFGHLSDFEKSVMRRVVPFYSWARANLPAQLEQLALDPGGKTATAVKASSNLQRQEGFQPPHVAETLGVNLGSSAAGTVRYLASLGLPFEDLRDISIGRGVSRDVGRTFERLLGQTNPLIKGPLELATGRQFYSGRDLGDLHGPTGDIGLDQLLMNSPLSRVYTTGRTLADPRKDVLTKLINVIGPAKLTDVDIEKAKDRAAQDILTDVLRGQTGIRVMSRPYVRRGEESLLAPEDVALMRLQTTLEKRAQDKAREQRSSRQ
jgi:hypothetical protein